MNILGIDIGGSGIKAAPVDTGCGRLLRERMRIDTPTPATPEAVSRVTRKLVCSFGWTGPIGIGLPAIIRSQIARTAANIAPEWIGVDARKLFSETTGCPVNVINDADAAGLAEMRFGAGRDKSGSVLVLTAGTGIGSALFHNGALFPNTEFGHIEMHGTPAEKFASAAVRNLEDLAWPEWGKRFNEFLQRLERLVAPDVIIIGGGISKKFKKFRPWLNTSADILPAEFHNDAGIVGAALAAAAAA